VIACFEEPVLEHLHLTIRGDGSIVATVVQRVAASENFDNPELAERLEASRADLAENLDLWSLRFATLEPLAERQSIERVDGELRRSIRSAVFESFDEVLRLVEADGLTGALTATGHVAALELFPAGGSRATYLQRQEVERRMSEWAQDLADYFAAAVDLYTYLEQQPDRAVPCLADVFAKHEGLGATGPLDEVEEELVATLKDSMEAVASALLVPDDEAFSLNELSRLVYDPFPARLTIVVDGELLEIDGFTSEGGFLERPAVDVWNALRSLEGRWLSPDLVTEVAAPLPEDRQPDPDVLLFASLPRRFANAPAPGEVEAALVAALVPEDLLRLRWRLPVTADGEDDLPSQDWLAVLAAAEASLPQ
jgi:hypothetical protein